MVTDDVIARVLAWAKPSSGDNLLGFEIDAEHAFASTEIFDTIRIEETSDPSCLLRVHLTAAGDTQALQDISSALRKAWSQLVYLGFEANAIEQYRDAVVMRFVTATGDGKLCVTGEAIATSSNYEQLVEDYERKFAFAGRIKERGAKRT